MVRFEVDKLIIEIPTDGENPAEYYKDLLKSLFAVYWLASMAADGSNDICAVSFELNWLAYYMGKAVSEWSKEDTAKLDPR